MKTAKEALHALDKFFSDRSIPEKEKANLWGVLTALRGPDSDDEELKKETTARIRATAFPLVDKATNKDPASAYCYADGIGAMFGEKLSKKEIEEMLFYFGSRFDHFSTHVSWAVRSLAKILEESEENIVTP